MSDQNGKKANQYFQQLVEQYGENVLNTCYGFLKNREDAEDASQEVFLEVYHSINKFRNESRLSTWIYRIAVSKSLDIIRKRNRKKRFGQLKQIFGIQDPIYQLPDTSTLNPEEQTEAAERSRVLYSAIGKLNESQKIALTLSKIEGFTNIEIADIMEISVSSVESLVHRAKKNLYNHLYTYYSNEGRQS